MPLAGNGLAVVDDAAAIDDATMLAFARETKLSETTYVQPATEPGADYRNRIWMTTGELPFAGHPSLGTAVAVALGRGDDEARYVQQTQAGMQPIDVRRHDETTFEASMLQDAAIFGAEVEPAQALSAAGLHRDDAHCALVAQVVSTGVAHLLAPVADGSVLHRARPDGDRLAALLAATGATCLYIVAVDDGGERVDARSFFLGTDGVVEDPATGSAAGPLLAYLHEHEGTTRIAIDQGVAMGRPSRIDCELEDGRPRVGGEVVVLAEGVIRLRGRTSVHA